MFVDRVLLAVGSPGRLALATQLGAAAVDRVLLTVGSPGRLALATQLGAAAVGRTPKRGAKFDVTVEVSRAVAA